METIAFLQCVLFVASFALLLWVLHRHVLTFYMTALFGSLIALNIYLVQAQVTILTEALTLPLSNLLIIAIVLAARHPKSLSPWLGIGFLCGLGMAIRPAFLALILGVVFALPLYLRTKHAAWLSTLSTLAFGFIAALILEYALYSSHHEERNSLLGLTLFGKAAIMTTDPHYNDTFSSGPYNQLETAVKNAFYEAKMWREAEKNILRKVTRLAELEVHAQYQLVRSDLKIAAKSMDISVSEVMQEYGKKVFLNNPGAYLRTSVSHYLDLWTTASQSAFDALGMKTNVPIPSMLLPAEPETDVIRPPSLISIIVTPAFFIMGVVSFGLLLLSLLHLTKALTISSVKSETVHTKLMWITMTGIGQAHLFLIAFINVSTARYLLSSYPFLLLAIVIYSQYLLTEVLLRKPLKGCDSISEQ